MTRSVSRRSVAQGIAWSVPAVAAAAAAPALAASPAACDLSSLPGGTVDGSLTRYTYERTNVRYVGVDGALGTVSWWTVAIDRTLDPRGNGDSADSRPLGAGRTTYQWVMTFPSYRDLYELNDDHRSYTTISSGDGLRSGGRIINQLVIDGVVQTFENEGDQLF